MTYLIDELWLVKRLGQHGSAILEGVTTPEDRRARIRNSIISHGLAAVIVGRGKDRQPQTYAQAFERLYGERLS